MPVNPTANSVRKVLPGQPYYARVGADAHGGVKVPITRHAIVDRKKPVPAEGALLPLGIAGAAGAGSDALVAPPAISLVGQIRDQGYGVQGDALPNATAVQAEVQPTTAAQPQANPNECPICHKVFASAFGVKGHMRVHQ